MNASVEGNRQGFRLWSILGNLGPVTGFLVVFGVLGLAAVGILAGAEPRTRFFALVGTFVVMILVLAVIVTLGMAVLYLAGFKTVGGGAIKRRFSLFMAWTLLRSHKRQDSLPMRLQARMDTVRQRTTRRRIADVVVAAVLAVLLVVASMTGPYNALATTSPAFATATQFVLGLLAVVFTGRAFPRAVATLVALGLMALAIYLFVMGGRLAGAVPAVPPAVLHGALITVGVILIPLGLFFLRLGIPVLFGWLDRRGVLKAPKAVGEWFKTRLTLQPFVSIVGVSLGIWALIVVLSVMRGFATDLQTKILRTNAHITVEPKDATGVLGDPYLITDAIKKVDGVREVQAMAYGEVMMSSSSSVAVNVVVKGMTDADLASSEQLEGTVSPGEVRWLWHPEYLLSDRYRYPLEVDRSGLKLPIDPEGNRKEPRDTGGDDEGKANGDKPPGDDGDAKKDTIKDVDAADVFGAPPSNPSVFPGILLGAELSKSLNVTVGSEINVISPDGDFGPTGVRPKLKSFRVAGIFTTGMYEYDQKLAYMAVDDAQRFLNLERNLNRLEIRVDDPETTADIITRIEPILAKFGQGLRTMSWRERNKSLFAALALERIAMFIILGLTIIVAALSILSSLTMIVVQRAKDIAVLKALGASNGDIVRTFLAIGGVIGFIATGTGLLIGLGFIISIDTFGVPLPKEYYITTLPVAIDPLEVVIVALVAMAICMAATWYPARAASRLSPVEGFRHG